MIPEQYRRLHDLGAARIPDEQMSDLWCDLPERVVSREKFETYLRVWAGTVNEKDEKLQPAHPTREQRDALQIVADKGDELGRALQVLRDTNADAHLVARRKRDQDEPRREVQALRNTNADPRLVARRARSQGNTIGQMYRLVDETALSVSVLVKDAREMARELDEMIRPGAYPISAAKQQLVCELLVFWRWATGKRRFGESFRVFATLALGAVIGANEADKDFDRNAKAAISAYRKQPGEFRLEYLPTGTGQN